MMVALGDINVMSVLSNTTNMIAEGEVQQLVNAKDPAVTEDSYFSVIRKKTAILFDSACEAAALVSGATQTQQARSEEHTSELQSRGHLVCRLLLEKKKSRQQERG